MVIFFIARTLNFISFHSLFFAPSVISFRMDNQFEEANGCGGEGDVDLDEKTGRVAFFYQLNGFCLYCSIVMLLPRHFFSASTDDPTQIIYC